jgi:diguanylate cyclase (GGDEF)-like protein
MGSRWRGSALRILGACMVGLGVLTGLTFPIFLQTMQIATADRAWSIRARVACLTAGVVVGGINYLLARLVVGGRHRRLTGHLRQVDDIVRNATRTGDWSALHVSRCQIPVDSSDELGATAMAFNALVSALDHNVAERQRLESRLHHQAFHDPLTGLANRALFVDRIEHALSRTQRDLTQLAVLFIDLDGFKTINDTLGHASGDTVLVEMSRRLSAGRRTTDTVARLGGDEFAVLLEEVDPDNAERVADQLCAALSAPIILGEEHVRLGASIGVARAGALTDNPHALLREADLAMYLAKRAGKNCYRTFRRDPDANTAAQDVSQ